MNIALLGTGLMGQALVEHLLNEEQTVKVFNRTVEKVAQLQQNGAIVATTAQEALMDSDICILMLSDAEAIQAVFNNIESTAFKDKLIIQMGTILPDETRLFNQYIIERQGRYLDCPVLGSLPEARTGSLILMAGGSDKDYNAALPILQIIGKNPRHIGDVGQGATVKIAINQLIAGLTASFALSLALVEKEGIETEQFMSILRDSALYAPTFDKKLDRMLTRDFSAPNFPTKHLAKDIRLFLSVAQQLNLETCALEGISQLLDKTLSQGLSNTDYSAMMAGITKGH